MFYYDVFPSVSSLGPQTFPLKTFPVTPTTFTPLHPLTIHLTSSRHAKLYTRTSTPSPRSHPRLGTDSHNGIEIRRPTSRRGPFISVQWERLSVCMYPEILVYSILPLGPRRDFSRTVFPVGRSHCFGSSLPDTSKNHTVFGLPLNPPLLVSSGVVSLASPSYGLWVFLWEGFLAFPFEMSRRFTLLLSMFETTSVMKLRVERRTSPVFW